MKTERIELRVSSEFIERLDRWRAKQEKNITKSEAVRILVEQQLGVQETDSIQISPIQKLELSMLSQILVNTAPESQKSFAQARERHIYNGDFWAIGLDEPELLNTHTTDVEVVNEVISILAMWSNLEGDIAELTEDERKLLLSKCQEKGVRTQFIGFDGNEESSHFCVAQTLIRDMNRFQRFKTRDTNSHINVLNRYRVLLTQYENVQRYAAGRVLNLKELCQVFVPNEDVK